MWKKGAAKALAVGGTFKRRWFKMQFLVVANDSGSKSKCLALTYFKSPEHAAEGAKRLLGHVNLSSATSIDEAGACSSQAVCGWGVGFTRPPDESGAHAHRSLLRARTQARRR